MYVRVFTTSLNIANVSLLHFIQEKNGSGKADVTPYFLRKLKLFAS